MTTHSGGEDDDDIAIAAAINCNGNGDGNGDGAVDLLIPVVATVGVGAHVGEITEHRASHDVGDQWRVGGGLTAGQQRQLWSSDGDGG